MSGPIYTLTRPSPYIEIATKTASNIEQGSNRHIAPLQLHSPLQKYHCALMMERHPYIFIFNIILPNGLFH